MKPLRYALLFVSGLVCTVGASFSTVKAQEPNQPAQLPDQSLKYLAQLNQANQPIAQLPVATRAIDNPYCPLVGPGFVNNSLQRIAGYESQNYYVLICATSVGQLYYYLANKTQGGTGNYVGYAVRSSNGYVASNGGYAYAVDNTQLRISQNDNTYTERVLATTGTTPVIPNPPVIPTPPEVPVAGRCPTDAGNGVMIARYTTHNHDVYICRGRTGVSSNPQQNYLVVAQDRASRPLVLPAASTSNGYAANDGNIRHIIDRSNYRVMVQGLELFTERVISCRGTAIGCGA
jgi:hypothetical protein